MDKQAYNEGFVSRYHEYMKKHPKVKQALLKEALGWQGATALGLGTGLAGLGTGYYLANRDKQKQEEAAQQAALAEQQAYAEELLAQQAAMYPYDTSEYYG